MSKQADALALRQMAEAQYNKGHHLTIEILNRVAGQLESDDRENTDWVAEIGKPNADSIREMVAALECDYDRLEELRAQMVGDFPSRAAFVVELPEESAELAELEAAAGDWYTYGTEPADAGKPVEFKILLGTGGPAVQIRGELDEHNEPSRAWLEVQDWGKPWTQYFDIEQDTLLTYCRCFYFGEG